MHWIHLQDFREPGLQLQIRNILVFISDRHGVSGKTALEYYIYKGFIIGSFFLPYFCWIWEQYFYIFPEVF